MKLGASHTNTRLQQAHGLTVNAAPSHPGYDAVDDKASGFYLHVILPTTHGGTGCI